MPRTNQEIIKKVRETSIEFVQYLHDNESCLIGIALLEAFCGTALSAYAKKTGCDVTKLRIEATRLIESSVR